MGPRLCIIPARALEDPDITPTQLRALLAIGRFSDRTGGGVWASRSTLAEVAGVDVRHFARAVAWLEDRGYVRRRRRKRPDGGDTTSVLEVLLDAPAHADEIETEFGNGLGGEGETCHGGGGETRLGGEGEICPPNDSVKRPQRTNTQHSTRDASAERAPVPAALAFADHPLAAAALEHFRAQAAHPGTLDATLLGLLSGLGAPGGRPVPAARLAQALADLHLNGQALTPTLLRSYLDRLRREEEAPATAAGPKGDGLSWKERERLRQKAIWDAHMIEMERLDAIDAAKAAADAERQAHV
jgi:hypothetical protein